MADNHNTIPSSSSSSANASTIDLVVRLTNGASVRLKDLDVDTTTVAFLRAAMSAKLGPANPDVDFSTARLFLAGFSLLEDDSTLAAYLGNGVTGVKENRRDERSPVLNVVPVKQPKQPSGMDSDDPQQQLLGMLSSLYKQRMPHKQKFAESVAVSSVEASEVDLKKGKTWTINGFKNGNVELPSRSSKGVAEFLPMKHAVAIQNCVDTTVRLPKCVHLDIVNCKNSTFFFDGVVTSVELTHVENCRISFSGRVPTMQLDMCKEVEIHIQSKQEDSDKTVYVCASTSDVSIHITDLTGLSLGTSGGAPKAVDIPSSVLNQQTASKLHQEVISDGSSQERLQWSLRTLSTHNMQSENSTYVRLNLLDSGEWRRQRRSQDDLTKLDKKEGQ